MTYDIAALSEQILQSPKLCGNVTLVTIDGPAGSGKTTLAHALAHRLPHAQVIEMDGLYNGWINALESQLWDRVEQLILQPLSQGRAAQYETFNWSSNTFDTSAHLEPTDVVILEGVGSSHPSVKALSSLNIWISAPDELLLDRVLNRDGSHLRDQMLAWQVAEREYFTQFSIETNADVHLSGN
jgi:uridine kinase